MMYNKKIKYRKESINKKLINISIRLIIREKMTFDEWYKIANEYKEQYGNLLVPVSYVAPTGKNLGSWIRTQRDNYRKGKISKDKQEKLEAIGMVWTLKEHISFQDMLKVAIIYQKEHGNLLVPVKYVAPTGEALGRWIQNRRTEYKNKTLLKERIDALENIGMVWQVNQSYGWPYMYKLAEDYYKAHGNLLITRNYVTQNGEPLGRWIATRRCEYMAGTLSKEKQEKLEAIGMVWQLIEHAWDKKFAKAKAYYTKHGHLLTIKINLSKEDENLLSWLREQRYKYKKGELSEEKIKKLESIGMKLEADYKKWYKMFKMAGYYYQKYGNLDVPSDYITSTGKNLGSWIKLQRELYDTKELTKEEIENLNSIGMIWHPEKEISWDEMYKLAKEYFLQHGNLDIPKNYVTPNNERLGFWLENERQLYKFNQLSKEKQEKLESIGIVWQEKICSNWNEMYELAKDYYLKFGDLAVSRNYIVKNGENLGKWIMSNRHAYLSGNLSPERIQKLEAIGMIWHIKNASDDIDIYLKELPFTIDKEINKNVLKYISLMELQTKMRFLSDIGVAPVDEKGKLIDIFTMSNHDIEEKYGVNIESLIKYYKRDFSRKLHL